MDIEQRHACYRRWCVSAWWLTLAYEIMNKRKILFVAIIAGAAIVALGFFLLKIGKSGPCAPINLPAKIGYTLVMLPTVPLATLCSILSLEDTVTPFISNPWGTGAFDTMAYAFFIFIVGVSVQAIRKSRTRGQHAVPTYRR